VQNALVAGGDADIGPNAPFAGAGPILRAQVIEIIDGASRKALMNRYGIWVIKSLFSDA
jgi:hypothetical protein